MQHKTKGIVLHSLKYGEASLIVHIYTREFGRQSYMVQGVRSKKPKFHAGYFQPLSLLELEVDHKHTRSIQRIRDLSLGNPLHQIRSDIVKSTISLFIGELLYRSLHEAEADHTLFDYLAGSIEILEFCHEGCANFHLVFLLQFTRFLGIFPQNNHEIDVYQPAGTGLKIHELLAYSLNDLPLIQLNNTQRNSLISALVDYYSFHLEGMGPISSLKILREVFL